MAISRTRYLLEAGVVVLSIILMPLSLLIIWASILGRLIGLVDTPKPRPAMYRGKQVKVLVTGASMAKGLFLTRTMYLGGCIVIAADFKTAWIPSCGRFSRACSRFYAFKEPVGRKGKEAYFEEILDLVRKEGINLWISCSGVATAKEDAQLMEILGRYSDCQCFQFNEEATMSLDDKYQFMKTTTDIGLAVPRWFPLKSKQSIEQTVQQATTRHGQDTELLYTLKNVAMDDKTRDSLPLLRSSEPIKMKEVLESLNIGKAQFIMQQFIPGKEEYCTQSLIIDGKVKAFLSCPSTSILMHYKHVEPGSTLDQAMLKFTQTYAAKLFNKHKQFTGHLSFDFLAHEVASEQGITKTLLPIECNPRCHTAVVRFHGLEKQLALAYLSILPGFKSDGIIAPSEATASVTHHWIAYDLIDLYAKPLLELFTASIGIVQLLDTHLKFWQLLLTGRDPTFEWWDPIPWFALNHLDLPARILGAMLQGYHWRQINVSTGKIWPL